jgi:hypothetical protein
MKQEIAVKNELVASAETIEGDQYLALIERIVLNPAVDPAKMQAILDVKERMMNKEAEQAFNRDYLAAKLKMPRVRKDGAVEYLEDKNNKSGPKVTAFKYAKYEDIDKAVRPIEEEYGFSRMFTTGPRPGDGGGIVVYCTLLHKSGHSIKAEIPVALDVSGGKNNIQAMGSSFSYGKRYTTEMIWDIVKEGADDDANSVETIDEKQFKKLKKLIEETETVELDFIAYYGIEALDQLPKKLFPTVENILLTKKNMQLTAKLGEKK